MGEFFINPGFLAGAAAASVPIIIHLLVRRRYRRLPWAAIDLLLRAYKKTNRRLRLENWLILFLRILAVLLIAFALARPVLRGSGLASKIGEKNRSVFLLLDNSYSMGFKRGRRPPFEGAKKAAADILASLKPGSDSASLILVSDLPEVVFGEPTPEIDKVKQALGEVQPGYGVSDLSLGLERLMEILALPAVARAPNKEVFFLTDGQRLAWLRAEPEEEREAEGEGKSVGGETKELKKKLTELAPKIESLAVVIVGEEETENLGIWRLTAGDQVIGLDKQTDFTVEVANFGPASEDVSVEFLVDGNPWASTHLTIPAGERQSALFSPVFRTPGPHWVTARLGADSLAVDDERFYALQVREQIRVLLVDGEPASEVGGGLFSGEIAHLRLALFPLEDPQAAGGMSIVRPEAASHFELTPSLLGRGWDLIIIANEGRTLPMDPELLKALFQYVRAGGSVLFFLGDRVRAQDYNEQLFQDGEGIFPLRLLEVKGSPQEPVGLALPRRRHPILQVFDDPKLENLLTRDMTAHYLAMEVPDPIPGGVRIIASFSTGDPAIVEKEFEKGTEFEKGRVMVVTTSADTEWTDFPKQGIFLPLVHEMTYYLVREKETHRNLPVGDTLNRPLTRAQYAEDISV
ncbi:MAG: BatA domain-containing protein, partial [Planctomycetota bacterium]